ncbi:hypothetical protein [Methylobacterium trifolii]|uniref:Uncharacterized protein n=1 Tax=Methylobacterium trifolii TaxID=1003092 RepID=A0ABQ4U590_9HYPH|nr:hypothetical protein [Methylobacterium trifolii]GJE62590.1 hypothetical protein MPOCJGCO_4723 [Methylobacterium trifolii]
MSSPSFETAPSGAAPTEADLFRQRMARAAPLQPGSSGAPRRKRTVQGLGKSGGFRLGWKSWLAIDVTFLIVLLAVVVAWQPVTTCREQEQKTGFYAGDSVNKCIRRGINERLNRADQRIKMLIRGSGH